jgi:tRNA threonylcarbamoyl adenosine modification protein YeaZ
VSPDRSAPVLAIDTSGSFCCVALQLEDGVVVHRESEGAGDHFERISTLVSEVLNLKGVAAADLGHLRVGVGPGSFTGLRIGMSFAKGFAVAARVPLVGGSSFAAVAAARLACVGEAGLERILVIADARREEVFLAEYRVKGEELEEVVPPRIEPVSAVLDWISRYPSGIVVTPNLGFELAGVDRLCVEARIAQGLLLRGVGSIEPFSVAQIARLEPNYLRAVAAKSIAERLKGA